MKDKNKDKEKDKNKKKPSPRKMSSKQRRYISRDSYRLDGNVPLITNETVLVTPEIAEKMLDKNSNNRPISWRKVDEYKKVMIAGNWKLTPQGIVLDENDNILTGQKRLWAVIACGIPQYFQVSRGCPAEAAPLLDRGTPQTARDLATRITERKHSVTEHGVCVAMLAVNGKIRPKADDIAAKIVKENMYLKMAMQQTRGIKKTKEVKMVMAAICHLQGRKTSYKELYKVVPELAQRVVDELFPIEIDNCWNKGAAFVLAMEKGMQCGER